MRLSVTPPANGAECGFSVGRKAPPQESRRSLPALDVQRRLACDGLGCVERAFAYDDLRQLRSEEGVVSQRYRHDSLGNRTACDGAPWHYNALNEIEAAGDSLFTFDLDGRLVCRSRYTEQIEYIYNTLDRLTEVRGCDYAVAFSYDPLDRRLSKRVYGRDSTSGDLLLKSSLKFLYDDEMEIGALDAGGRLVEFRVLGEGLDADIGAAVAMELDGTTYCPIHDLRGDIVSLVSQTGSVETRRYAAFGELLTIPATCCPYGLCGKRIDFETGLVYFGKRYYAPDLGRWISRDPLGYEAGLNLYTYCSNRPLIFIDAYGLFWAEVGDFFKGVGLAARDTVTNFVPGVWNFGKEVGCFGYNMVFHPVTFWGGVYEECRSGVQFCREHSWKDIGVHGSAFLVGCVSHSGADLILNHESYDQKELWTQIGRSAFDCALLGTTVGGGVTAARAAAIGKGLSAARGTPRANFNIYESLAEVPLSGITRSAHRNAANRAFSRQLEASPELQRMFNQQLGGDVLQHMNSGAGRNLFNPPGAVWHHPRLCPELCAKSHGLGSSVFIRLRAPAREAWLSCAL